MGSQAWNTLWPVIESLGCEITPTIDRLRTYTRALLEWNRGASNLVSYNDEGRIVERHLLESLLPGSWLKASGARSWIDLGSGGGFPAIPLAIAGVGEAWTLVESRRNKTLFMRKIIGDLGLSGITVVCSRMEDLELEPDVPRAFDGFTSRATMKLGPTLALAAPLIRPDGVAFLWKGSGYADEVAKSPDWRIAWRLEEARPLGDGPNVVAKFVRLTDD
jgi:16S rRNA (guanine527-N7)-methyltransferase